MSDGDLSQPVGSPAVSRPDVTARLARGIGRMLAQHGLASVRELPLGNGRRADLVGLDQAGALWIVEIKSGLADYLTDGKWQDYLPYCDAFYFGVAEDFPIDRIPFECGLIVADGFGGEIIRPSPLRPLASARRKAMTLTFARLAATRLLGEER